MSTPQTDDDPSAWGWGWPTRAVGDVDPKTSTGNIKIFCTGCMGAVVSDV